MQRVQDVHLVNIVKVISAFLLKVVMVRDVHKVSIQISRMENSHVYKTEKVSKNLEGNLVDAKKLKQIWKVKKLQ